MDGVVLMYWSSWEAIEPAMDESSLRDRVMSPPGVRDPSFLGVNPREGLVEDEASSVGFLTGAAVGCEGGFMMVVIILVFVFCSACFGLVGTCVRWARERIKVCGLWKGRCRKRIAGEGNEQNEKERRKEEKEEREREAKRSRNK